MALGTEILAGILTFVYVSFVEWFVHYYYMHQERHPFKDAYRGHVKEHHTIYQRENFQWQQPEEKAPHVTLRWYAFPGMMLIHLPFFVLLQYLTGWSILWGCLIAPVVYYAIYEYIHYLMHVPKGHFVERMRWYQFLREHHRLHHKYVRHNFNIFVPLADYCMGTLITSEDWRSKPTVTPWQRVRRKFRKETAEASKS